VETSAGRFLPQRPFPPYAYLPGRDPHPTGDPRGHSFGRTEPPCCWLPPERWRDNADYLFGCDLYNAGFLWEAHEAWEGLWHASKHDPDQAEFLQGLIQCAAASLKVLMQQPRGLEQLAERGTERLALVQRHRGTRYMGLDLLSFVRDFRAFAASAPDDPGGRPRIELED
jgi:hypothetical protein